MAAKETVLLIGATGNIGVSAALGALAAGRDVLAIVRNQDSAEKLFQHVGSKKGITTVEADITSDEGVQGVVEQVEAGKLPSFQHVYSCIGGPYEATLLKDMTAVDMRNHMRINFELNFFAYTATIPYLLAQNKPNSSWTLCTGSQGDAGERAGAAMSQGALYSLAVAAARENATTNIRFNEVYLAFRVEVDESAKQTGAVKASEFAAVYEQLLNRQDIRNSRVVVLSVEDIKDLQHVRKV